MGNRKTILGVALLAALPWLCFWEVLRGDLLLPTDWLHQDLEPWRQLTPDHPVVNSRIKDAILDGYALDVVSARAAKEGRIALWNPYAGGGVPHLAAGFSRMLYPPFWIYAVLDTELAHNIEILLHLFLAQLFAFIFLRRLGLSLTGSILGAIVYGFTPSITHRAEISFILPSLVWFPLLLTFVEDLVTTGRPRAYVGLAVAVAFQLLAGHYPDIFINFLGATIYGITRLISLSNFATSLRRASLAAGAVVLGASLAAPFLFPSLEFLSRANRAVLSATELAATGLGSQVFLTAFSPELQRSQLYIGLLPLIFVPAAFRRIPRGPSIALLATVVVGIGLATGSPLFTLLHSLVPGVERLRYLQTHVALASFGLALLAGIGFSVSLESRMRWERVLALLLLGLGVAAAATGWFSGRDDVLTVFRLPFGLALLGFALLAMELKVRQKIAATTFAAMVGAVILVDLFSYARAFNPRVDTDIYPPFPEFPAIEFLRNDPDTFRVATLLGNYHTPFWPNTLGAYQVQDVGAYHSLLPKNLGSYVDRIRRYARGSTGESLLEVKDASGNWAWLSSFRPTHLLRNWNIKYFALPAGWPNPDPVHLELVYDDEVRLFLYQSRMPRAWLAERAMVLPGERGINARLLDPKLRPERTVLLSTEPACYFPEPAGMRAEPADIDASPLAEIVEYRAEHIVVETRSAKPSYLVMSESFDPGWHARVDGKAATILEANLYFRAVPLPAGSHRVELFYLPASYTWGWRIFGLALLVVVLVIWLSRTQLSERSLTAVLVAASVGAPLIGLLGWRSAREVIDPEGCGQLRVAERFVPHTSAGSLRMGPLAVEAVDVTPDSEAAWPIDSSSNRIVRAFATARSSVVEARVAIDGMGTDPIPLADLRSARRSKRWSALEAPVPAEAKKLLLQVKPGTHGTVSWGNPLVFEPRARQPSKVCFVMPERTSDLTGLLSGGADDRLMILLTMRTAAIEDGYDEIHFASDRQDFSARMLSLARTLYRRGTFLVLDPAESDFVQRQRTLLERELKRLDLEDHVLVETCEHRENGS